MTIRTTLNPPAAGGPDSAVELDTSGKKPKVVRIDLEHCKGCGICAHECPPARKGKGASDHVPVIASFS